MARAIYEVKLNPSLFPCNSAEEVDEMLIDAMGLKQSIKDSLTVEVKVKEEHTVKLFILGKTLFDTEKFEWNEVFSAVCALAQEFGYGEESKEIADSVLTWCERLSDMDSEEFDEWLIG